MRPRPGVPVERGIAEALEGLIAEFGGIAGAASVAMPPPRDDEAAAPGAHQARAHRFTVTVPGDEVLASLMRELSVDTPPPAAPQLAHVFDTDDGILFGSGYRLQLVEEPRRFVVVVDRQGRARGRESEGELIPAAQIDGRWAAEILSGHLSPVAVLERRLGRPLPPAVVAVAAAVGERPLRRVAWRKRLRQTLGPVVLPFEEGAFDIVVDFDTVSAASGQVEHEVEVTVVGGDAQHVEDALRQLFSRIGVDWQASMARRWLTSVPRRPTGTGR